jgi:integrase
MSSNTSSPLPYAAAVTATTTDNISSLEGKPYLNYINSIKSPATQKTYIFSLKKYMRFHNYKTIDELLADKNTPTIIEEKIIEFIIALRTDSDFAVSYRTRATYFTAILTFYDINDIILRKKKIERFLGEEATRKYKDRAYTTEEIKKLLDYADIRSKAVVLLLASTGMRIGALSELKMKHLTKIPEYNLYQVTVYENTKDKYNTFCTPECAKAIDDYLGYRKTSGEKIIDANAPVIRERFDRIDIENTAKKKPEPVATRGISEILYILLTKSGLTQVTHSMELQHLKKGSERKAVKRAHGFRKFFNTNLVRAKVNIAIKELLLGHKSNLGLDKSYYRPSEQEVLQEYCKAIDYLTINDEHRLQRKVVELTQKQDDIEMLKTAYLSKEKRIDELEKQMKEFLFIAKERVDIRDKMIQDLRDKQPPATEKEIRQKLKKLGWTMALDVFNEKMKEEGQNKILNKQGKI